MGKKPRFSGPKKRKGTFYKGEEPGYEEALKLDDGSKESYRDVSYLEDQSDKATKLKKQKKADSTQAKVVINSKVNSSLEEEEEEEATPSSYQKLVTSLTVSEKYREILKRKKLEEEGREDEDEDLQIEDSNGNEHENSEDEELARQFENGEIKYEALTAEELENEVYQGSDDEEEEEDDDIDAVQTGKVSKVNTIENEEFEEEEDEEKDEEITENGLVQTGYEDEVEGDEFAKRFDPLYQEEIEKIQKEKPKYKVYNDSILGDGVLATKPVPKLKNSLKDKLKGRLLSQFEKCKESSDLDTLTDFQKKLFPIMTEYNDLFYCKQTSTSDRNEIRELYVLHALNHVIKTRDRLLKGNAKLNSVEPRLRHTIEVKDSGFTRARVLILVPFRHSALELVELIMKMAPKVNQEQILNKKRFTTEFTEEDDVGEDKHKPKEWNEIFQGNIDDCFRIGIAFTKQSIKLYSEFYNSDIIIASPLGIRMNIGTPKTKGYDHDFLSSIEVAIVDQADVMLMQNWDHLDFIFDHLNLTPSKSHETDFSRVREWYLNEWAKYYRQTMIFSSISIPEMNSLWNKKCFNTKGSYKIKETYDEGTIVKVIPKIKQIFIKISCQSIDSVDDTRFQYFTNEIVSKFIKSTQSHTMIFIPSYFDFVRIRNYFKGNDLEFGQCCEYTPAPGVARARSKFKNGTIPYLLVTERFHFYNRYKIRGIEHIIFYGVPVFSHYYSEFLNLIENSDAQCTVLFSKFDKLQLERLVGSSRANRMIESDKSTFLFC